MNILKVRNDLMFGKTIYDMNLNVGYYARVSTDKSDQLNSLENQSNYFKDMINSNKNWNLVGEYIDEGISGTSVKNRNNFLRMINDSHLGKLDLIVTKEISRFSRNVIDSIKYSDELLNNGTAVLFISDNINTIYPDSEFRLALMSSLAQDEVRKLSERVKFGIKRKIRDGELIGGKLTGYDKLNGRLIINKDEKEIIETLFNLYVTRKYSIRMISNILYKKGFSNKNGKEYSSNSLIKMLTNPRYKGFYTANMSRTENYKSHKKIMNSKNEQIIYKSDLIEPIVSEELWDLANNIYNYNKLKKSNIKNLYNLDKSKYTGKIFCFEHNKIFIRNSGGNRINPSWTCSLYRTDGVLKCNSPIIKEKQLDSFMIKVLLKKIDVNLLSIKKILFDLYSNSFNELYFSLKNNFNIKLKDLERTRDKIIDLNLNGIISDSELNKRLSINDKKIDSVVNSINSCNYDDFMHKLNNIFLFIDKKLYIKNNLDFFIDSFLEKIFVFKGSNRYSMKFKIVFKDGCIIEEIFDC